MNNPIPEGEAWGVTRGNINNKAELTEGVLESTQVPLSVQLKSGEGINYIVVDVSSGDPLVNGSNLRLAYNAAKLLTPNGSAIGVGNSATVILPPATYDLGTSGLVLDKEWVSLQGSSPEKTAYITAAVQAHYEGTLMPVTDNVNLTNLSVNLDWSQDSANTDNTVPTAFAPNTNLYSVIRNCHFAQTASIGWRNGIEYPGEYFNLTGHAMFGCYGGEMSGIAFECSMSPDSSSSYCTGVMSGEAYRCNDLVGGGFFGGHDSVITGKMVDCYCGAVGGSYATNSYGKLDGGILINCEGNVQGSFPAAMTNGARLIGFTCHGYSDPNKPTRDATSKMVNCSWGDSVFTDV